MSADDDREGSRHDIPHKAMYVTGIFSLFSNGNLERALLITLPDAQREDIER